MQFHVGDRVIVAKDYASGARVKAGDKGVVTYSDTHGYMVRMGNGLSWAFADEDLIPYPIFTEYGYWCPDPRCECGAERLNHPGHSSWCPKYSINIA